MKRIIFFMSLALLCRASIGAQVNVINAKDFKKMHVSKVCKIGDGAIAVIMDLEIPMFSASLQRYLAKEMFNSNEESLPGAVNMFLSAHGVGDENDLKDLSLRFVTFAVSCVSYSPGKYVTFLVRYPDPEKLMELGEIERVTRCFVYDISEGKVLAYEDIFSEDYVEVFYPDDEHSDFLFQLDYDYLSYGKDSTLVKLPLCQLKDYLTPQFQQLIDWGMVNSRAKSLNIKKEGIREIQTALKKKEAAIDELNSKKEALYQLYLADNNPYRQIHLYMHYDECWVSGLNKSIMQLTDEDMTLLKKKGKQVLPEIEIMKEWLKQRDGERVGDSIYFSLDEVDNILYNLPDDSKHLTLSGRLGYEGLVEYMRTHLSLKHDTVFAKVMIIVLKDGSYCPVVLEGENVEVDKEIIAIIRKHKNGKPYHAHGKPVIACVSRTFSFVKKKSSNPLLNPKTSTMPLPGRYPIPH